MNSESHQCAEVATGVTNTLSSCDSGTVSLLWVEPIEQRSTPGVAWVVADSVVGEVAEVARGQ